MRGDFPKVFGRVLLRRASAIRRELVERERALRDRWAYSSPGDMKDRVSGGGSSCPTAQRIVEGLEADVRLCQLRAAMSAIAGGMALLPCRWRNTVLVLAENRWNPVRAEIATGKSRRLFERAFERAAILIGYLATGEEPLDEA